MLLVDSIHVCLPTVLIVASLILERPEGECTVHSRIRVNIVRKQKLP